MINMELSETDKAFFNDGYKLGLEAAEKGLSKESLYASTTRMFEAVDGLIDSLLSYAKRENVNIDCKKGCSYCCYQPIYLVSHEVDYLYDHIKRNFSNEKQRQVLKKAAKLNEQRKKMDKQALMNHKAPCPLLDSKGNCMTYTARPMACRIYLSMSVASCRLFYEDPVPAGNYAKLFEFPLQAGRMMNEGFTHALKTAGRNSAEFRIEEGLTIISGGGQK
jgi:Fe-S-cluster containining protein